MNRECATAIAAFVYDLCQFYYTHGEIKDSQIRDITSEFFLKHFLENDIYHYQAEWVNEFAFEKFLPVEAADTFKQILNNHLKLLLELAQNYSMHKQERAEFLYFPLRIGDESVNDFMGDNGIGLDEDAEEE